MPSSRRDLPVSMHARLVRVQAHPNYRVSVRAACSSGAPAPELVVLRCLQTTAGGSHRDREVSPTGMHRLYRDREVSPTRASLASSPPSLDVPVVRGPVPRVGHRQDAILGPTDLKRRRDVFSVAGTMARDRPSPYGESGIQAWRGTGPRPTVRGAVFFRSAGACPPRTLDCADAGEGQALALRCGVPFFFVVRGPVPATLNDL